MFCPSCGIEDRYSKQFCRACGTDLRLVQNVLSKSDIITASAAKARDEIGRAFAQKIREMNSATELSTIAEDGLPYIEKFLESPEERRLRRIRAGSIISFIGLGTALAFSLISTFVEKDLFIMAGLGVVCLFIGLSFIVNGVLFSSTKKVIADKSVEDEKPSQPGFTQVETNELILPESNQVFTSVIEETTQHLKEKQPVSRS